MPKVYGLEYQVDSARCYQCNGSGLYRIPLNKRNSAFQVCPCPFCKNGVADIWYVEEVPLKPTFDENVEDETR